MSFCDCFFKGLVSIIADICLLFQGSKIRDRRSERYGYDANLDYLTSANYGDGLANQAQTWTYDAAGNRASDSANSGTWSYDNLNRMTASLGLSLNRSFMDGWKPTFQRFYGRPEVWADLSINVSAFCHLARFRFVSHRRVPKVFYTGKRVLSI